jgi:hypothetical protein
MVKEPVLTTQKVKSKTMSDPKKKKGYVIAPDPKVKVGGGKKPKGTNVSGKSVSEAKMGAGAFKSMNFTGKQTKAGYKSVTGKFNPTTGPVSARANKAQEAKERKVFTKDSTVNAARTKRFAHGKKI